MAQSGGLLGGLATGLMAGSRAKDREEAREERRVRRETRARKLPKQLAGPGGPAAPDTGEPEELGGTGPVSEEEEYADGGKVGPRHGRESGLNKTSQFEGSFAEDLNNSIKDRGRQIKAGYDAVVDTVSRTAFGDGEKKEKPVREDKSNRRRRLDEMEDEALKANGGVVKAYADGGSLGVTYDEKPAQEKMGGVSGEKVDNRNAGKRPPQPAHIIGTRGANGGEIGYANGGLLYAPPGLGNSVTGYVQHGSTTQTTDPLWHAPCVRDFGKKG